MQAFQWAILGSNSSAWVTAGPVALATSGEIISGHLRFEHVGPTIGPAWHPADVPPPHAQIRSLILESERRLRDSFDEDAGRELALGDDASSFLAGVMGALGGAQTFEVDVDRAGIPSGDVKSLKLMALKFIGVRTVRVVRAARSAFATGYEPEARSYDRILVELIEHRQAILDDTTSPARPRSTG